MNTRRAGRKLSNTQVLVHGGTAAEPIRIFAAAVPLTPASSLRQPVQSPVPENRDDLFRIFLGVSVSPGHQPTATVARRRSSTRVLFEATVRRDAISTTAAA